MQKYCYKDRKDLAQLLCTNFGFLSLITIMIHSSFLQVIRYTLSSLVAELGGTLGLFVGFSFFTLWDVVTNLANFVKEQVF